MAKRGRRGRRWIGRGLSRRQLLQRSGAAAASLGFLGCGPGQDEPAPPLVGAGWGLPASDSKAEALLDSSAIPDNTLEFFFFGGLNMWDTFYAVPEFGGPGSGFGQPWPTYPAFPLGDPDNEYRVQEDLGFFLKDSLPGFRGADLQGLAAWEETYGRCRHPEVGADWITELATAARDQSATNGQALTVLKDRLLNDPVVTADEAAVFGPVMDIDLGANAGEGTEDALRWACGVFLAAPQLHLAGLPPIPALVEGRAPETPVGLPGDSIADFCAALSPLFDDGLDCG